MVIFKCNVNQKVGSYQEMVRMLTAQAKSGVVVLPPECELIWADEKNAKKEEPKKTEHPGDYGFVPDNYGLQHRKL